jgi:hypothetical protein
MSTSQPKRHVIPQFYPAEQSNGFGAGFVGQFKQADIPQCSDFSQAGQQVTRAIRDLLIRRLQINTQSLRYTLR